MNADDCPRPSEFVLSVDGKATQSRIWAETVGALRAEAQGAKVGDL